MNIYKALNKQVFNSGAFSLVPIRFEDRIDIMKWRNEQIYHLRQTKPLTIKDQDYYFQNTINKIFDQNQPTQILFSFLENEVCIGYGGLVHVNWKVKNAEISFIMNTELEEKRFEEIWSKFLRLIEEVAFLNLELHKIYTHAIDVRPRLYDALEKQSFVKERSFKNLKNDKIIIHSKIKTN